MYETVSTVSCRATLPYQPALWRYARPSFLTCIRAFNSSSDIFMGHLVPAPARPPLKKFRKTVDFEIDKFVLISMDFQWTDVSELLHLNFIAMGAFFAKILITCTPLNLRRKGHTNFKVGESVVLAVATCHIGVSVSTVEYRCYTVIYTVELRHEICQKLRRNASSLKFGWIVDVVFRRQKDTSYRCPSVCHVWADTWRMVRQRKLFKFKVEVYWCMPGEISRSLMCRPSNPKPETQKG